MARSAERTLKLLFCVASSPVPLGLTELSAMAGLDKATAMRMLSTLESFRLVHRDEPTRKYSVGSGVWQLARAWRGDLSAVALPHMTALRDATGETVSLIVPRGLERVVLTAVEAAHELRVVPGINSVVPIHLGASGRVIMAFLPEDEQARIIRETGLRGLENGAGDAASDVAAYLDGLAAVRTDGYAVSSGDVTLGAAAVAAPVRDMTGALQAVVSLRGPESRMTPARIRSIIPHVVATAEAVTREIEGLPASAMEALV